MFKEHIRSTLEEAESMAIIWAMQYAQTLDYHKIIFEGDCKMMFETLKNDIINMNFSHYLSTI